MSELKNNFCTVCALPAAASPCSARCRHLSAKKREVDEVAGKARESVVAAVRGLKPNTTICPGYLAQRVLSELGMASDSERDSLLLLRSHYLALREANKIRFYQKGKAVAPGKYPRGPFRLGPR